MAKWFWALDLKSGDPRFKFSTLPLNWICFPVVPSSTPPLRLVNVQLVGIFNSLCLFALLFIYLYSVPISIEVLNTSTLK